MILYIYYINTKPDTKDLFRQAILKLLFNNVDDMTYQIDLSQAKPLRNVYYVKELDKYVINGRLYDLNNIRTYDLSKKIPFNERKEYGDIFKDFKEK
jgi:hypothetical protein